MGEATDLAPERLRELGLQGARIGLTQFRGHYRDPMGNLPHEVIVRLQAALPKATLYPENDVLKQARLVKSPEEIAVIEQVTAANEEAIRVLCETARPGLPQEAVWYAMAEVLIRAGRGWPARLSVTFNGPANQTLGMPIPDPIPPGALCSQEICARILGYRAQCNHTIQVGAGGPPDYPAAMRATVEVYQDMLGWLRPGLSLQEVCERYLSLCGAHGARDQSGVVIHTNGLGNDYPRVGPRTMSPDDAALVLAPGHTFTFKPVLRFPSGATTQYGEPLTITATGARRLGKRAQTPIIVAAESPDRRSS